MNDGPDAPSRASRRTQPASGDGGAVELRHAELLRFVRANERKDVTRLLLGTAPPGIDLKAAVEQIRARRKAQDKVPGWNAIDGIVLPAPLSVEQASSQSTADYKAALLEGEHVVDLCGGMGVDTVALARRFGRATYVERDAELCASFARNAGYLGASTIEVVNADAQAFLEAFSDRATFYLDPARRGDLGERVFRFADCSPDIVGLLPLLETKAERVLVKASPMIDLTEGIRLLRTVRAVHVVSVANECKEVLFVLEPAGAGDPVIRCVNLKGVGELQTFTFDLAEERAAISRFADAGRYLYDPNASIRKAGAFKSVGAAFGLAKLAAHTHLYTADVLVGSFPGRVFEIEAEAGRHPRRLLPEGRANVISRNHPLSAEQLRARYGIKDGGDRFLIGYRDLLSRARLVLARRVDV